MSQGTGSVIGPLIGCEYAATAMIRRRLAKVANRTARLIL